MDELLAIREARIRLRVADSMGMSPAQVGTGSDFAPTSRSDLAPLNAPPGVTNTSRTANATNSNATNSNNSKNSKKNGISAKKVFEN